MLRYFASACRSSCSTRWRSAISLASSALVWVNSVVHWRSAGVRASRRWPHHTKVLCSHVMTGPKMVMICITASRKSDQEQRTAGLSLFLYYHWFPLMAKNNVHCRSPRGQQLPQRPGKRYATPDISASVYHPHFYTFVRFSL